MPPAVAIRRSRFDFCRTTGATLGCCVVRGLCSWGTLLASVAHLKSAWRSLPASAARAASQRREPEGPTWSSGQADRPSHHHPTIRGTACLPGIVAGSRAWASGSAHDQTPLLSCGCAGRDVGRRTGRATRALVGAVARHRSHVVVALVRVRRLGAGGPRLAAAPVVLVPGAEGRGADCWPRCSAKRGSGCWLR